MNNTAKTSMIGTEREERMMQRMTDIEKIQDRAREYAREAIQKEKTENMHGAGCLLPTNPTECDFYALNNEAQDAWGRDLTDDERWAFRETYDKIISEHLGIN